MNEDQARAEFDDAQHAAWVARNEVRLPDADEMKRMIVGAGFEFEDANEEHGEANFTLASGGWAWLGMRINGVTDVVFGWPTGGTWNSPPDYAERAMGVYANFSEALRFVVWADDREVRQIVKDAEIEASMAAAEIAAERAYELHYERTQGWES